MAEVRRWVLAPRFSRRRPYVEGHRRDVVTAGYAHQRLAARPAVGGHGPVRAFYPGRVSTTTPLPNKVKWTTDEAGGVVVHTRQAFFYGAMFVGVVGVGVLLCGLALGFASDHGFWRAGFLGFAGAFGALVLVEANILVTHHKLLIDGGTVRHRWRRLIGLTYEAPVSGFMILHASEDGDSGPWWELGVEHADGTAERGLWVGELPELIRLGTELQERTGLPFDPEPRPAGRGRRPG